MTDLIRVTKLAAQIVAHIVFLLNLLHKFVFTICILLDEVNRFGLLTQQYLVEVDGRERRLALLIHLLKMLITFFVALDHSLSVVFVLILINTLLHSCVMYDSLAEFVGDQLQDVGSIFFFVLEHLPENFDQFRVNGRIMIQFRSKSGHKRSFDVLFLLKGELSS